jgi:hypothetical protein
MSVNTSALLDFRYISEEGPALAPGYTDRFTNQKLFLKNLLISAAAFYILRNNLSSRSGIWGTKFMRSAFPLLPGFIILR